MSETRSACLSALLAVLCTALAWYLDPQAEAPPEPQPDKQVGDLRIMTWNVGGTVGRFGRALPRDRQKHVAGVIRRWDPDILVLQELQDADQMRALQDSLGSGWQLLGQPSGDRMTAIGWRGARVQSLWTQLPYQDGMGALLQHQDFGRVGLMGLHADAYDSRKRNRLLGYASDKLQHQGLDLAILAGDLNLDIGLSGDGEVYSDDEHRDLESYNYLARTLIDTGVRSGSTIAVGRRLDYIFIKGLQVRVAGPIRGQRLGDMDHDPMIADCYR